MLLLDTNVVSEYRKVSSRRADPNFIAWQRQVLASQLYISAITILELEIGILRIERKDEVQGYKLRQWFEYKVLPSFEGRILAIDTRVALTCGRLHVPDPRSERDALIAATAIVHGMKVVTRNVIDFKNMDVGLMNPWD